MQTEGEGIKLSIPKKQKLRLQVLLSLCESGPEPAEDISARLLERTKHVLEALADNVLEGYLTAKVIIVNCTYHIIYLATGKSKRIFRYV